MPFLDQMRSSTFVFSSVLKRPRGHIFVFAVLLAWPLGAVAAPADSVGTKVHLCASCHGANGLPSDQSVPIIWGQQPGYIKKQLSDYKNDDRDSQIMSSIAESLSDADVSRIAIYFGGAAWPAQPKASLPAAPAAIATCKVCHGANLTGAASPAGIAPRLAGQGAPYLIDTMTAYANGERANSPLMASLMYNLSTADRKAIAGYLAAMR
jgi:cytochrome c553